MTRHTDRDMVLGHAAHAWALGCTSTRINYELDDGDTAWNPAGDHFTGPLVVCYLLRRDDKGSNLLRHEYWQTITVAITHIGHEYVPDGKLLGSRTDLCTDGRNSGLHPVRSTTKEK